MQHPPPDEAFREEMAEQLEVAESALLALEQCGLHAGPRCVEHVQGLFRAFHTIKGLAGMVGCTDVAALTHVLESILEPVRRDTARMLPDLLELVLAARDLLAAAVQAESCHVLADELQGMTRILEQRLLPVARSAAPAPAPPLPEAAESPRYRWHVRFAPNAPDLFGRVDVLELLQSLEEAGARGLTPQPRGMDCLELVEPATPLLAWECEFDGPLDENGVRDLFIFVEDAATVTVRPLAASAEPPASPVAPVLPVSPVSPPVATEKKENEEREATSSTHSLRRAAQTSAAEPRTANQTDTRVDARKLEHMVGLVGELVIAQSRLLAISTRLGDAPLQRVVEELEYLSASLRDQAMGMRMASLGTVFGRLRRTVRDLCHELGKDAAFIARGGETELDKTVLEQLATPLLHLLRNALEHGLETPAERRAAGKPPRGAITLDATQAAGTVIVTLADDGRGLDHDAIAARAQALGLVRDGQALSDDELFDLLCQPGFSPAPPHAEDADTSRGLELMRRTLAALRGQATLTSTPGSGVTVQIRLPLTMAIIEGLQVRVGQERFIIPLAMVEECVELHRQGRGRDRLLALREALVPCVFLRELFSVAGETPAIEHVVVTQAAGQRTGLVVDEVLGQQQAVVKPLGALFRHRAEFAGAAVQGDGDLALILDVPHVVQAGREQPTGR
ncbi:chemotaxis protein CheA [Megalodesulfovibrio gigas]|uniref:Chemotaxis protein CheA n=1 Tax=Megalodesulfovibrio gigas (strain ATCC 19364 / DSM 1382 / NCIMB 9332 / VKM B-1759) TaxID=1121448 RepID=T2GFM3_MEGG1|nr:chemotaxis protein CheA [Megalodesulfovibrio gigas]AGW14717.1 putative CheA signal transduction histidine kinase [Megalodesulfovibrio gigas DSM 1382 = ATCC 19364]